MANLVSNSDDFELAASVTALVLINIVYALSRAATNPLSLLKVVITMASKDQNFSEHPVLRLHKH